MKFKDAKRASYAVGDKVKILPSAVDIGVPDNEVGRTGVVKSCTSLRPFISIFMDEPRTCYGNHCRHTWGIKSSQIELMIVKGQQLLFEFMSLIPSLLLFKELFISSFELD